MIALPSITNLHPSVASKPFLLMRAKEVLTITLAGTKSTQVFRPIYVLSVIPLPKQKTDMTLGWIGQCCVRIRLEFV